MRKLFIRLFTASSFILLSAAFSDALTAPGKLQGPVLAAWTELVGDRHPASDPLTTGHTVLRVITSASTCPKVEADGRQLQLSIRENASSMFPVTTCQATPPAHAKHLTVAGVSLNTAPTHLERIIILGDTGCRLKGTNIQDCNDVRRWPFPLVAAHAAAKRPDLIIHVGDYYYRETPCPANAPGCAGSPHGDRWASWAADFFDPTGPLLTAAPWIFVRGNHEACGRGVDGWFRFLAAAAQPQRCEESITEPPFTVRLDGLTLNIMDSADTDCMTAPTKLVDLFANQFDQLGSATETGHGWILTHQPIWGLDPEVVRLVNETSLVKQLPALPHGVGPLLPGYNAVDFPCNRTEQVASDSRKLAGTEMVVSGHLHLFTALSYGSSRPAQLIVGNGGDSPDVAVVGPSSRTETIDSLPADIFQLQRYGYLMMDHTKQGWTGTVFSVDDEILGMCEFTGRQAKCLLTPTLPPQLGPTSAK